MGEGSENEVGKMPAKHCIASDPSSMDVAQGEYCIDADILVVFVARNSTWEISNEFVSRAFCYLLLISWRLHRIVESWCACLNVPFKILDVLKDHTTPRWPPPGALQAGTEGSFLGAEMEFLMSSWTPKRGKIKKTQNRPI